MTELDRYRNLVFCGVQDFGGSTPKMGIFHDPVTQSSFSVLIDAPLGPSLDELKRIWGEPEGAEHA